MNHCAARENSKTGTAAKDVHHSDLVAALQEKTDMQHLLGLIAPLLQFTPITA
jgi:hypothetical protein